MVYYGFWYTAKTDALMAFIRQAQRPVTGEVRLNLYKGNIIVAARESANSLYDAGIASMEGGGSYNQTDAEGFLRSLPGSPDGKRALVLGAGGAARAIVWALLREGAEVEVWNRTELRSKHLCEELGALCG